MSPAAASRIQLGRLHRLVVGRRPGREVQFDNIKSVVREVYFARLRDAVINAMRPRAQITLESVTPVAGVMG